MKKHLTIVCIIWCCYLSLALLMTGCFVGFSGNIPIEGYLSYLFGFGYFINEHISRRWTCCIPISDWRWLLGVLIMLVSSLPPLLVRKIPFRVIGYVFLVCVQVMGLYGLLHDMICAAT